MLSGNSDGEMQWSCQLRWNMSVLVCHDPFHILWKTPCSDQVSTITYYHQCLVDLLNVELQVAELSPPLNGVGEVNSGYAEYFLTIASCIYLP